MNRMLGKATTAAALLLISTGSARAQEPTNPAAVVREKFDLKNAKPMTAGSFMVMPKGAPHFAWTRGETILQIHAIGPWGLTYVNPKDDPRNK